MPVDDPAIRKGLRQLLVPPAASGRWVEEMALVAAGARVDAAVIGVTELVGIEIKSEVDSLSRLQKQALAYSGVFDKLVLVAAPVHMRAAETQLPRYWGLLTATAVDGCPRFRVVRPAAPNPDRTTAALLALLWRRELLEIARDHGVPPASSTRMRRQLQHLPLAEAARRCRQALAARDPGSWLCRRTG